MRHLIIKLHGTSGSGKTTAARYLFNEGITEIILNPANRKPEAYQVAIPYLRSPLFILGPYTATCGGLDSLSNVDDHIRLLQTYGQLGHVFYEGLLGSEYYGRIGKVSEQFSDRHVFAFLDTPIEVCLERVRKRRELAGNLKPFNESNTRGRIAKIERLRFRLEHEFIRPTCTIDYTKAGAQIADMYKMAEEV